uniref:Transposase Tc1-like domain-containing protein n=1 Tax=Esox lucius TaxID=8010 RepID=A0AAY5KP94_ESOLU
MEDKPSLLLSFHTEPKEESLDPYWDSGAQCLLVDSEIKSEKLEDCSQTLGPNDIKYEEKIGGLTNQDELSESKGGKALSKDLRDKVVDRHKSGDGYKKISKALSVPRSTVKSIIKKWKIFGTTQTLPGSGRRSKLDERARRRLVREATKRPTATLKQLQEFMTKSGHCVHVTTISQILHKCDLYGRVARKKPLLKKDHMQ